MSLRRWELAAQEFRAALAADPDEPQAHALLALALLESGQKPAALAEANTAVRLAADWWFPHYICAHVLNRSKSPAQAIRAAREALRLNPRVAEAWEELADAYHARGEWRHAMAAADEGLKLEPDNVGLLQTRTLATVAGGTPEEAERFARAGLTLAPDHAGTRYAAGWLALHDDDPAAAAEHFRESLRQDPTSVAAVKAFEEAKWRAKVARLAVILFWAGALCVVGSAPWLWYIPPAVSDVMAAVGFVAAGIGVAGWVQSPYTQRRWRRLWRREARDDRRQGIGR